MEFFFTKYRVTLFEISELGLYRSLVCLIHLLGPFCLLTNHNVDSQVFPNGKVYKNVFRKIVHGVIKG